MRSLTRGPAPACLADYRPGHHRWDHVSSADKKRIWRELDRMQQGRCAYCERDLESGKRHIEHFRARSMAPELTFAWENLFGSCQSQGSCGHYKDAEGKPYEPEDLIKPDAEDPEHFLVFDFHGGVSPRHGLPDAEHRRARETIRVLNLDGGVRAARRSLLQQYAALMDDILRHGFPEPEVDLLLDEVLRQSEDGPFPTAVRQVLRGE
ncbi:retron Ec78 anti-phage system effector HNH endonuclease PtuB [Novispirillum itersonii]|uniref:Uncharacterized protein (TIGR02646 family) n=1 Tax=Novispirillum itersonii TaxID=189 RepID=A0A7X0DN92_NOVIT|nr:retron Ec78 anti-phage system effector HNH endonuclease PtuB [Novispirillum itersonii]MBB6211114.1 uncharacterized protein (TIGR02646 family) [Novispirillum itersonii]